MRSPHASYRIVASLTLPLLAGACAVSTQSTSPEGTGDHHILLSKCTFANGSDTGYLFKGDAPNTTIAVIDKRFGVTAQDVASSVIMNIPYAYGPGPQIEDEFIRYDVDSNDYGQLGMPPVSHIGQNNLDADPFGKAFQKEAVALAQRTDNYAWALRYKAVPFDHYCQDDPDIMKLMDPDASAGTDDQNGADAYGDQGYYPLYYIGSDGKKHRRHHDSDKSKHHRAAEKQSPGRRPLSQPSGITTMNGPQ